MERNMIASAVDTGSLASAALLPCLCPKCGTRSALKAVATDPAAIIHPEWPKTWRCKCGNCGTWFKVKL
ncbi:hypothetical protein [Zavarzinella formosa]|uniref:hypothetical protein n=1 Tax=Zavarzinella formosa TaxID=360055 RepID=UPI0002F93B92|nr:hypothetical protein [Zavarzinella formosa]